MWLRAGVREPQASSLLSLVCILDFRGEHQMDGMEDWYRPSTELSALLCHSASMFQLYLGGISFHILPSRIANKAAKCV